MQEKLDLLKKIISEMESVLVAYSGGVDSALVAKVAFDLLKERSAAVTALSPSYPSYEKEEVVRVAGEIGIRHFFVETREIENARYRANEGDRCYFCKKELYTLLRPKASEMGLRFVVNGIHVDDLGGDRPGIRASGEEEIRSPLVEAGLNKSEIRNLARTIGLSVADKPQLACLASRIPVGTEVTRERLARIDRIEGEILNLGFRVVRVRDHDPLARIEVGPNEIGRLLESPTRERINSICQENGFSFATIDLAGYKTL